MKTARKVYKFEVAVEAAKTLGFVRVLENSIAGPGRLVTAHSDFLPSGEEFATLRLARGRYRGNVAATIFKK